MDLNNVEENPNYCLHLKGLLIPNLDKGGLHRVEAGIKTHSTHFNMNMRFYCFKFYTKAFPISDVLHGHLDVATSRHGLSKIPPVSNLPHWCLDAVISGQGFSYHG